MKYKITKETKPTLSTFGKYKATAIHGDTVDSQQILREVARQMGVSQGTVAGVALSLGDVIKQHLRRGDRVRLDEWGLMKLEIESDKVDAPSLFQARQHIRGVRLHFLPESSKGKPELYQGLRYEKV